MATYLKIEGLTGMAQALRELPVAIGSKGGGPVRGALFVAARLIRDEARMRAPRGVGTPAPGNLKKQIFVHRDRNPKASTGATERYLVAVRSGKRTRKKLILHGAASPRSGLAAISGDAFYWHFVEFGTVKQPAQSYMRNAFEAQKVPAVNKFTLELRKGVTRAVNRMKKKYGLRPSRRTR